MKFDKTNKLLCGLMFVLMAVAGCGGSGAGKDGVATLSAAEAEAAATIQVTLQANSTTLAADGLTPVELTAVVTQTGTGIALAGQTVSFSANDPLNAVRLEVTQATTDASGVAMARLFLNGNPAERAVRVSATVGQATPSELSINVATEVTGGGAVNNSRGELTVRLGTDNKIEDLGESLSYRKSYVAIVSDSAGVPKPNATITAVLRMKNYYVGYWALPVSGNWFTVNLRPDGIPNEDVANFGYCDAGEDVNGDKVLTPGNAASATVRGPTNAAGAAVIDVVYPKSFARWLDVELEATATVGGSEGFNSVLFRLPILASDVTDRAVAPPSTPRTRASLSTAQMVMAAGDGDEAALGGAAPAPSDVVAGSPFPYLSSRVTCP